MKSIVTFIAPLSALIVKTYGQTVLDRAIGACQSAMNDPENVKSSEGEAKRGGVKGGMTYGVNGLSSKDMSWTETTPVEYTAKQTAPIEFVKLNDNLATLFKKIGSPSGELSIGLLSTYHREWLDKIAAKVNAPKVPQVAKVKTPKVAKVAAPATPAPATAEPAKPHRNGNIETVTAK